MADMQVGRVWLAANGWQRRVLRVCRYNGRIRFEYRPPKARRKRYPPAWQGCGPDVRWAEPGAEATPEEWQRWVEQNAAVVQGEDRADG